MTRIRKLLFRQEILFNIFVFEGFSAVGVFGCGLAGADEFVFVDEQSFESDWPSCVDFVSADSDLGAEPETVAVTKAGACVPENVGGID